MADLGSKSSVVKNKRNDHAGCMLILDITIDNWLHFCNFYIFLDTTLEAKEVPQKKSAAKNH